MMPFDMSDMTSIPENLRSYWPVNVVHARPLRVLYSQVYFRVYMFQKHTSRVA